MRVLISNFMTSVSVIRVPLKKDYDSNDHLNEKSESEICPRLKRAATQSGVPVRFGIFNEDRLI